MVAITLHNKSHAWDGKKGNSSKAMQKSIMYIITSGF
jgi:hypothetical protein